MKKTALLATAICILAGTTFAARIGGGIGTLLSYDGTNLLPRVALDTDDFSWDGTTVSTTWDTNLSFVINEIIDTNGVLRYTTDWGFSGDYPGRIAFGYLDALTVSASNRTGDVALPTAFEPSGLYWHDVDDVLYAVGDEGRIARMRFDGTAQSNYIWSAGLDFEAVTCADPDSQYIEIGCERWLGNTDRDMILRVAFNDAASNTNQWRFDISEIIATTAPNAGMEALAFIPSNAVPSWAGNDFSEPLGLFLAADQEEGRWYLIDVPLSTTSPSTNIIVLNEATNLVASWLPRLVFYSNRNDCAELYFDSRWNRLYAVYDEDGAEGTDPPALSTRGRSIYRFDQELLRAEQEWGMTRTADAYASPEGFTLGPNRAYCFIANDVGDSSNSGITRYRFDAYGRETRRLLDVTMPRAPDAEDDASMGYGIGSMWADSTGSAVYVCEDDTADAAVWSSLTPFTDTDTLADVLARGNDAKAGAITNVSELGFDSISGVRPAFFTLGDYLYLAADIDELNDGASVMLGPRGGLVLRGGTNDSSFINLVRGQTSVGMITNNVWDWKATDFTNINTLSAEKIITGTNSLYIGSAHITATDTNPVDLSLLAAAETLTNNVVVVSAKHSGDIPFSANVFRAVPADTEYIDTHGAWNTNGTFTAPRDGTYFLYHGARWATAIANSVDACWYLSGSAFYPSFATFQGHNATYKDSYKSQCLVTMTNGQIAQPFVCAAGTDETLQGGLLNVVIFSVK